VEGATLFTMTNFLTIFEMTDNAKRMLLLTFFVFVAIC